MPPSKRRFDSPNMSDTNLLVSVEDLINMAMGPYDMNVVNFKMIQTVLHILARQLRLLETNVEIRISEIPPPPKEKKKQSEPPSSDTSSSKSPHKVSRPAKSHMEDIREEKAKPSRDKAKEKEDDMAGKEKEKAEKAAIKEKEKEAKLAAKEQVKAERAESKDREKAERAESKEREKAEKSAAKEKDKAERLESKERDKAERAESKERDKSAKERPKSKERDKAERAESKERDKSSKAGETEKERAEKTASKDKAKLDRMDTKNREKAEREKDKLEKMDAKDRERAEKEKEKADKVAAKEKEKLEKMSAKEKEKYLKEQAREEKEQAKLEKMDAKDREKAEREKDKLDKIDAKERERAEKEQAKLEKMDAKDRERAERQKEKDDKAAAKEKEKMEKMSAKEKEKYLKEQAREEKEEAKLKKMDAKDREKAEREKDKLEKMDAKDKELAEREKEKAEKAAANEKEKLQKMSAKEKEKYLKEKAIEEKERAKSAAKTGISIKERQKDKVLIVEKGPTTRSDSTTRLGSIEVVTQSQFELLEAAVRDLTEKAGPLPFPALPDNEKLRSELAKGSASLTETMQAMQVAARVQAAETAIGRMAGLLQQLAAAGALPEDVAGKLEDVKAEMDSITEESTKLRREPGIGRKSVAIDPMYKKESTSAAPRGSITSRSPMSRASIASRTSIGVPGVTHIEMDDAIRGLKDELVKNVTTSTARATTAAETASAVAKSVADKLDVALKLNERINSLNSLVGDYAEQLNGFDAGLTTQMQSFQEQMVQMRGDLKAGITLVETANNNAETAAVLELTERYDGLVMELDLTLHSHQGLAAFQNQLSGELHSLLECVEMMREQKADRDEVQDGLRDKADNSRLAGLLSEAEFALTRAELERRLDLCYDKFRKQEQVWMGAIKDLTEVAEGKAEIMQLMSAMEEAQQQLRDIQDRQQQLAVMLGEPKAAIITRLLSRGARCGVCQIPALQVPVDSSYGKPYPLPAFRLPPAGEEKPCAPEWRLPQPPDDREHACHRWVGGSHTLLADSVVREQAGPLQMDGIPTRRYTGYGSDGRLYMMEEELQPCLECNILYSETEGKVPVEGGRPPDPVSQADGAGDTTI